MAKVQKPEHTRPANTAFGSVTAQPRGGSGSGTKKNTGHAGSGSKK